MSDPSRTVEFVNDLNNCEIEIRIIKDEIETQSQTGKKYQHWRLCVMFKLFGHVNKGLWD